MARTLSDNQRLAWDTLRQRSARGIPSWLLHVMDHAHIERLAGREPGSYRRDPVETYIAFQRAVGTCLLDQFIPDNPLTMDTQGWTGPAGATTGAIETMRDGICINSPEAVAEHLERFTFPRLCEATAAFDEDARVREILADEAAVQERLGPDILKAPYGICAFPALDYTGYGYGPYFAAWALYPEMMERHFALQADLALRLNAAAARAYLEGGLPPVCRLDHDMADSRGTLASLQSLERLWFPHFARSLEPLHRAGVKLLWHCDGNLMAMVPRLLDCGLAGFQGFQYEDGMDYAHICRMKTRGGDSLIIIAGVSVTRTLPFGAPSDVRREMDWLVENGPPTGLFLAASSSIAPGVPWENLQALVEGLRRYRGGVPGE